MLYLEQSLAAFVAHFGNHGHTNFENQTSTGKPAPFKYPLFRPEIPSPLDLVQPSLVTREVQPVGPTLAAPGKPLPLPQP